MLILALSLYIFPDYLLVEIVCGMWLQFRVMKNVNESLEFFDVIGITSFLFS